MLAAAGIPADAEVDIQSDNGRIVIQLQERTQEQLFDKLLEQEPGAKELLKLVSDSLAKAITDTDATTAQCYSLLKKLEQKEPL